MILGDAIEGEARDVALVHAASPGKRRHGQPAPPPCVLLSGGETTVTVRGKGRGGRNVEFLLALAIALDGLAGIHALAADTDGIDGTEDNAGADHRAGHAVARRANRSRRAKRISPTMTAIPFFAGIDDLVVTGPTHTNVNDFRAIIIERAD